MSQLTISREEALALLRRHMTNENLMRHCLATEAIMRALAPRLDADPETLGIVGLVHDIDFESTKDDPASHTVKGAEILAEAGFPDQLIGLIQSHNAEGLGRERSTPTEHALAAAETITGLIIATTLVYPDKKIASVKPKSVIKRMKKKDFARAVNRDIIRECELFGMELTEFVQLSLEAMQTIASDLGL
ncbi:HDIG domain-containing metalloprotein [candidate division KSB1 bacterium]